MGIPRLSPSPSRATSHAMNQPPPLIFDRLARRLRRDRMARSNGSPLESGIASELLERLDLVTRSFECALVINTGARHLAEGLRTRGLTVDETDHGAVYATAAKGLWCDEDRLRVARESYDLVVMPSGLDTVDDVPGALIAARAALKPGGLFLASLVGAPSLPVLRGAASSIDADTGYAVARFHPQIDVRAAGDLLARTGFALPVADSETLELAYGSFDRLLRDLRNAGLTNLLANRHVTTSRWLAALGTKIDALAGESGRVHETVTLLFLTGWAPQQNAKP